MIRSLQTLWRVAPFRWVAAVVGVIYWLAYQLAIQDLVLHGRMGPMGLRLAEHPWEVILQRRSLFQFEPVALLQLPFLSWTLSPMNGLIGAALALLVALNAGCAWIAVTQPRLCRARPSAGLLAAVPALLAGSACCAPVAFLVLGLPVTASIIGLFDVLLPLAALLLLAALRYNLHRVIGAASGPFAARTPPTSPHHHL